MRSTLFLFLLCLPCSLSACLASDVLNAGQNITGNASTLVSDRRQEFVLGFFSPPESPTKSYLGIWYNEELYPGNKKVVVWVANRDDPVVGSNGFFQIADDGNLVVTNTSGGILWSSELKVSSSRNRTVKLMDSGNLVLMDGLNGMSYVWQSFQHPTDTFLPGMEMDSSLELTSWRGVSDPGRGNFTFKMSPTGKNRYVILNNQQNQLHWEYNELNSDELTPDTLMYFTNFTSNKKEVNKSGNRTISINISDPDTTRAWEYLYGKYIGTMIVMNSTGEIQFLKWENENNEWLNLWKKPSDNCNIYNYCGNFSSCHANDWMNCKCLPGFSPISVEGSQLYEGGSGFHGCQRKSTSYDNNNTDMVFLNLTMTRVGRIADITITAETEEECQSLCLNMSRPRCQAYTSSSYSYSPYYRRSLLTCGIWTQDLTTLPVVDGGGSDLSILVKSSDIAPTARSCEPCGIYTIPYPLSTGPNCGDPMYNNFNCDYSTGQVSFRMPHGESYRVTWIDESSRKFYIQTTDTFHCYPFNQQPRIFESGSAFNVTNLCFRDNDVEISWAPAPEPPCFEDADCNSWPNSTCSKTREGKRRCLCNSRHKWNATNLTCSPEEKSGNRLPLILTLTLTSMIFLACTIIFAFVWRNKVVPKIERENNQIQESLYDSERHVKGLIGLGGLEQKSSEGIEVPFYTFESILEATDNFSDSNILGRGGYGPVYKGRFSGGQDIAVKRLSSVSNQGLEEFKNEVVLIAKLQHRNLVRLRGYCIKGDEKILLYEYMPNKSLDSFIFDRTRTLLLDWQMRFDIILGIARGLLYLHQDSILRVIHRDLKTSNILLDEEMIPKISDFGLAKIFGGKEIEANTNRVVGTYGYMAPEYALDGYFSIKSDVFSFGVVLLEILSGKRNTGFYQSKQTASLLGYAWGLWTENRLLDLMDSSLCGACNEDQFIKCAVIGLLCVQDEPGDRPTMSNVVTMLDSEIATIPTPTQPTFYAMKRINSSTNASSSPSSKPETTLHFDTSYQQGR